MLKWTVTNKSLFSLTMTDLVFYDTTLENGDVELSFGTGTNGARLPQNGIATVRYVLTAGANGNLGLEGAQVSWAKDSRVVGRVIETAAGGADIKPISYYKNHGAVMKTASESLVSMPQWKAAILGYPGVADVVIQTQRDIAPNDPSWRN